ncbi:MAG: PilZ domain-containing protein [Spirochaetaceae bacterium]|jgi:hypothetical protein|nr:PilZ domain-containing protein [Spirochaetaceae bacterium]
MFNNRENVRHPTLARARIKDVFEGEALLKDLSITGCCIECTMYINIKPDTEYKVEIIPESQAQIGNFELVVSSRWIKTSAYSCEIGFAVISSPKGKLFQRYVDYISWRAAAV